jgi:ligand-binding SRPBCC domain-containing protein
MSDVFSNANDLRVAQTELLLRTELSEAFWYFADPRHLESITPQWHDLTVDCPEGSDWIREGAEFTVRLVVHGHAATWTKRVVEWEPEERFVLEQVDGPYTQYRHERVFEKTTGGTRCLDRIEYAHIGGSLFQRLVIQPELEMLLAFRHRRILERFGLENDPEAGPSSSVTHATG